MDYVITSHALNRDSIEFRGRVFWQFPKIRWEHTRTIMRDEESQRDQIVIIDNAREMIRHDVSNRKLYVGKDRERKYDPALRVVPWLLWSHMEPEITWQELLDLEVIEQSPNREIDAVKDGDRISVKLKALKQDSSLEMQFDASSGLIRDYSSPGADSGPVYSGSYEWQQVEGVLFPTSFTHSRKSKQTSDESEAIRLVAEFSGFSSDCSKTNRDFDRQSLKLEGGTRVITFQNSRIISDRVTAGGKSRAERLKELGERAGKKGFASEK